MLRLQLESSLDRGGLAKAPAQNAEYAASELPEVNELLFLSNPIFHPFSSFFIIFHPDSHLFRLMLPRRLLQKAAVPIRSSLSSSAVDSTGTKQTCRYVQTFRQCKCETTSMSLSMNQSARSAGLTFNEMFEQYPPLNAS